MWWVFPDGITYNLIFQDSNLKLRNMLTHVPMLEAGHYIKLNATRITSHQEWIVKKKKKKKENTCLILGNSFNRTGLLHIS